MTTESQSVKLSREEKLRQIGEQLHKIRCEQGVSIEEVAATLKLRSKQIQALEEGDWSHLPDSIYGLGFLRQYASYLRVDIADDIQVLKSSVSLRQPMTIPDPAIAPSRRWAWLSLSLFVVLLVYFNLHREDDLASLSLPDQIPPEVHAIVQPLMTQEALPPVSQPEAATDAYGVAQTDVSPNPPAEEHAPDAAAVEHAAERYSAAVPVEPPVESSEPAAPSTAHTIDLSAAGGDVWLRVTTLKSADGSSRTLKETLLHDGQRVSIGVDDEAVLLTAGNALSLTVSVDGVIRHAEGTLGSDGKVMRNLLLPLNPASE